MWLFEIPAPALELTRLREIVVESEQLIARGERELKKRKLETFELVTLYQVISNRDRARMLIGAMTN